MSKLLLPMKSSNTIGLLGAILLLGLILRVWGVWFGLPYLYHADEPVVVNHALAYSTGDLNPHFFRIPPLISYLLFGVYGLAYLAGNFRGVFQSPSDFEALFYQNPSFFYITARFVFGVIPGTLSIGVLYSLIRRYFDERTAMLSAFLFAVSFLHVRDSHYIYVDIPLILMMLLSFNAILKLSSSGTLKNHAVAGALIGVAAAIKYNGLFLVVSFLIASVFGKGSRPWRHSFLGWITAGLFCCGIFILLNPYGVLDWRFFLEEVAGESRARAGGTGLFHHFTYSLIEALGYPHLILSLLAIAGFTQFVSGEGRQRRWILAAFVLFYYGVIVFAGQHYDRYVLPLLPFMAFFAADALLKLSSIPKRFAGVSLLVFICLAAAFPLAKSILVNRLFAAKDIRTEAKEWIESNIPAGSKIALDTKFYMPPLSFSREALERKRGSHRREEFSGSQTRRLESLIERERSENKGYDLYFLHEPPLPEKPFMLWGPFLPPETEALKQAGVEYLILVHPERFGLLEKLKAVSPAQELKQFTPYRNAQHIVPFDSLALTGAPFLWSELWNRRQNGQPFQVYKVEQALSKLTLSRTLRDKT